MSHEHKELMKCEHKLRYCGKCDETYCDKCHKTWGNKQNNVFTTPYIPPYQVQPSTNPYYPVTYCHNHATSVKPGLVDDRHGSITVLTTGI